MPLVDGNIVLNMVEVRVRQISWTLRKISSTKRETGMLLDDFIRQTDENNLLLTSSRTRHLKVDIDAK